jgi:hypothetical protein
MIDPNFDPYQELIDCRTEVEVLKQNFLSLIHTHNQMNRRCHLLKIEIDQLRKYQQQLQAELAEIKHS